MRPTDTTARRISVSIGTIGYPFPLYSYGNHIIFGTFYALVLVLSYGKYGHFKVEWPDFPKGWACYEHDFRGSGKNNKYIEFYHTVCAAAARARGPCNMARQLEVT
jgi:hypothetical protein